MDCGEQAVTVAGLALSVVTQRLGASGEAGIALRATYR